LLGAAAVAAAPRAARAQPVGVVPSPRVSTWSPEPPPPDDDVRRLDDGTALTLGAHKLSLGILAFKYGITDWLSVGIDPPYWLVAPVAHVLVPNAHAKLVALRSKNLWIAGNVGVYYAFVGKNSDASGRLLTVPLTAFVSWQAVPRFWIHPDLTYTLVQAFGTGDFKRFTLGGTAATRTVQVGLMLQYELTRVVSVLLTGRYQPYTGAVGVSGSGAVDQFTTATVDGQIFPGITHPWNVVPGVALMWKHVRLTLGAGYGNYFLPGMDIAVRGAGFVPEGSFYVVL